MGISSVGPVGGGASYSAGDGGNLTPAQKEELEQLIQLLHLMNPAKFNFKLADEAIQQIEKLIHSKPPLSPALEKELKAAVSNLKDAETYAHCHTKYWDREAEKSLNEAIGELNEVASGLQPLTPVGLTKKEKAELREIGRELAKMADGAYDGKTVEAIKKELAHMLKGPPHPTPEQAGHIKNAIHELNEAEQGHSGKLVGWQQALINAGKQLEDAGI